MEKNLEQSWHPDIGATNHTIDNQGNLHLLTPYSGSNSEMVGNGKILHIIHTSQAIISSQQSRIQLKNVLVIPNIKKNLLSISKLTYDYPLEFIFDEHGFVIRERITKRIVDTRRN